MPHTAKGLGGDEAPSDVGGEGEAFHSPTARAVTWSSSRPVDPQDRLLILQIHQSLH